MQKEKDIARLQNEVAALYTVLTLLHEPEDVATLKSAVEPVKTPTIAPAPIALQTMEQVATVTSPTTAKPAGWDALTTRWP